MALACVGLLLAAPGGGVASGAAKVSILGDPVFAAAARRGLAALYDFRFPEARAEFAAAVAGHAGHPVEALLEILPDWWGSVLLNVWDTSRHAAVEKALDEVLARSEARLARDPADADGRFFRAAAFGFRGRLRSLRAEWIPAAWDGRRALALVRELHAEQPDNQDLLFGLGLYDYFAAVVPQRYAIFRPLKPFFPAADRERGLERLRRARDAAPFAATEAAWALVFVYGEFEEDPRAALAEVRGLRRRHPHNPIFHLDEGRTLAELEDWRAARAALEGLLERRRRQEPGYGPYQELVARYLVGRSRAEGGDAAAAVAEYLRVEPLAARAAPRSAYRTLAWLRCGLALDALGRRGEAVAAYRRVLALRDVGTAHRRARLYLDRPAPPGVELDP